MDQARRRLLLALGASALVHGWLVQTGDRPGAQRATTAGTASLIATLIVAPEAAPGVAPQDFAAPEIRRHAAPAAAHTAATTAESRYPALAPVPEPGRSAAQAASGNTSETAVALAPASDPTYYTARSLDVYPQALTALDLGMRAGSGKVRATVLIDESGTVNDVRAIEGGAVEIENAARDLLLRTRFSPASKDGRWVKAQLLLSLEYGTAMARE